MSESIRRKSSSRQLLQNLISLTAQRSQEDAEEVERERRRRAREVQRGDVSPSWPEPPQHSELTTHNTESNPELKPRCCLVLEEDEGFSDWSHRLEHRSEREVQDVCRTRVQRPATQPWKPEEEKRQGGAEEEEQVEEGREPERSRKSQEASTRPPEKTSSGKKEVRKSYSSTVFLSQDSRQQNAAGQPADRTSYLVAGTMKPRGRGACRAEEEVEEVEEVEKVEEVEEVQREEQKVPEMQSAVQREWRSAETQQSPRGEEDQEEEELSFTHEHQGDLHPRRGEEEEEEQEEEHKILNKRSTGSRRSEEEHSGEGVEPLNYGPMSPTFKRSTGSRRSEEEQSGEGVEPFNYGPMSPTFKRSTGSRRSEEEHSGEGVEPLNYGPMSPTLKRSTGSRRSEEEPSGEGVEPLNYGPMSPTFKRSTGSRRSEEEPSGEEVEPLNYGPMSPTFKKLLIQFYPEEVNSRVSTDGKCTIIERTESLRKSTSGVKKSPPPVPVSKIDRKLELYTHALEVSSKEGRSGGPVLADLIPTEPVSSKKSLFEAGDAWNQNATAVTPSKDADGLKVGVANLINQWVRGSEDGSRCSSPSRPAESSMGKRYKFVVTGHGKYEKVSVNDDFSPDATCQSAGHMYEDL